MKRLNIYYCTKCGSISVGYGGAMECCGEKIEPAAIEPSHQAPAVSETDGEYLLEYDCPMSKDNHIAAVVAERYDRVELIRLFAEQAPQVRLQQLAGAKIYTLYCRQGKAVAVEEKF